MQSATSNFKATRVRPGESISGKVTLANFPGGGAYPSPFVAYQGQMVMIDPASLANLTHAADDATALKFATGAKCFHLDRDIIAATGIPLSSFLFNSDFLTPEVINTQGLVDPATAQATDSFTYASAREVLECELEGPDYLLLTNGATGVLTAAVPVETLLSTIGGKLYVAQAGDEPVYRVLGVLKPTIATNTFRLLVGSF